jgi:hypothetical protein
MHGEEEFIGGADHAELSAHRNIFGLGYEDRIAHHKLTDRGMEVVISSSYDKQVMGHGSISNKACAIRL